MSVGNTYTWFWRNIIKPCGELDKLIWKEADKIGDPEEYPDGKKLEWLTENPVGRRTNFDSTDKQALYTEMVDCLNKLVQFLKDFNINNSEIDQIINQIRGSIDNIKTNYNLKESRSKMTKEQLLKEAFSAGFKSAQNTNKINESTGETYKVSEDSMDQLIKFLNANGDVELKGDCYVFNQGEFKVCEPKKGIVIFKFNGSSNGSGSRIKQNDIGYDAD